jgi:dTDP-4-amino-4,6-dideoxygalactose transaminase
MKISFIDLQKQYKSIKKNIDKTVSSVIQSGKFILGPDVELLEKEIAKYCGTEYAVAVASGTDALHLALLGAGIKQGDEVITTPFTFIATTETIAHCGAIPVFVDIDPVTFNIDVSKIKSKITNKTRAILPVHLFGHACNMDDIMNIATSNNLKVIEDCAQAMGTTYKAKHVGSIGDAGTLSFFPTKNLGCYGDGGMIITNTKELAEKLKQLRNHGSYQKYYYNTNGFNSRLDSIQAAILRVKLKNIAKWIKKRREIARLYTQLLKNPFIIPPYAEKYTSHSFNYYTIKIQNGSRSEIQKFLAENGIPSEIYYPQSLHLQEAYNYLNYKKGDFPVAEKCQNEVLSLPIYPELSTKEVKYICKTINKIME